jgi:hypothetical protein
MKRLACLLVLAVLGCAAQKPRVAEAPKAAVFDPCADRLQEICGIILQYYVDNHQLPADMEQLQAIAIQQHEPGNLFVCPVSHLRYVYNASGIPLYSVDPPAKLVMYDAQPVHNGRRWGIAITPAMSGRPVICRVVSVPGNMNLATTQP